MMTTSSSTSATTTTTTRTRRRRRRNNNNNNISHQLSMTYNQTFFIYILLTVLLTFLQITTTFVSSASEDECRDATLEIIQQPSTLQDTSKEFMKTFGNECTGFDLSQLAATATASAENGFEQISSSEEEEQDGTSTLMGGFDFFNGSSNNDNNKGGGGDNNDLSLPNLGDLASNLGGIFNGGGGSDGGGDESATGGSSGSSTSTSLDVCDVSNTFGQTTFIMNACSMKNYEKEKDTYRQLCLSQKDGMFCNLQLDLTGEIPILGTPFLKQQLVGTMNCLPTCVSKSKCTAETLNSINLDEILNELQSSQDEGGGMLSAFNFDDFDIIPTFDCSLDGDNGGGHHIVVSNGTVIVDDTTTIKEKDVTEEEYYYDLNMTNNQGDDEDDILVNNQTLDDILDLIEQQKQQDNSSSAETRTRTTTTRKRTVLLLLSSIGVVVVVSSLF